MDGSEIRESVISILELERLGIDFLCCSPDVHSAEVIDHISGNVSSSSGRNMLTESARIARGNITNILDINPQNFDMLLFPGGLGVAKFASSALLGSDAHVRVRSEIADIIKGFHSLRKAIGAICISPAVVAASLRDAAACRVTLGDEGNSNIIERCGGVHVPCPTDDFVFDTENAIFSSPAYMRNDKLHRIQLGVQKMVQAMHDYTLTRLSAV